MIAGKVLRSFEDLGVGENPDGPVTIHYASMRDGVSDARMRIVCTVGELKALAASALTQTRNKGPIEATARPKKAGRVGRK